MPEAELALQREIIAVVRAITAPKRHRAAEPASSSIDAKRHGRDAAAGSRHRRRREDRDGRLGLRILDRLREPILVMDADGVLRLANRAADALLSGGDGLAVRNGRLVVADRVARERLLGVIAKCAGAATQGTDDSRGAIKIPRPSGCPDYLAVVDTLEIGDGTERALGVLVHLVDPEPLAEPDPTCLEEAFGFTRAEAGLAADLVSGRRLADVAVARGVAPCTVKTQLLALFAKTGTSRQGDLVRLLERCLATCR